MKYAVACRTPWFWEAFAAARTPPAGELLPIHTAEELTTEALERFGPRYIFFPHWSQLVPKTITDRFECVCFHATPVPYGRGGSPIQNMIVRGHQDTSLTALRMVPEVDAGPIYLQRPVSLLGGLDEIFIRIAQTTLQMMSEILTGQPEPTPQVGSPETFKRRSPADSAIPSDGSLQKWFDCIRMLDAENYPRAFVEVGGMKLEFSRPALRLGRLEANVVISPKDSSPKR
jgi:methionyl-tRNA formyltransferase